jgi:small-conductance mechanosensitive channel
MSLSTQCYDSRAARGGGFVVDTAVTIGYATPWRQVHALLEEAARRTPNLATTSSPMVRQAALGDFYIEYPLAVCTSAEQAAPRTLVLNDLHTHILDVFNEYGVQIMSPPYEADPDQPHVVAKQAWYVAPAPPCGM